MRAAGECSPPAGADCSGSGYSSGMAARAQAPARVRKRIVSAGGGPCAVHTACGPHLVSTDQGRRIARHNRAGERYSRTRRYGLPTLRLLQGMLRLLRPRGRGTSVRLCQRSKRQALFAARRASALRRRQQQRRADGGASDARVCVLRPARASKSWQYHRPPATTSNF